MKPEPLHVAFSCKSLERPARTKGLVPQQGKAVFGEELLLRALTFCSAERLLVTLETKPPLEASVPLRAALPRAILEEDEELTMPQEWPPRQRLYFRGEGDTVEPYLDLEMLQLVDGSVITALGPAPLLRALERRQEQLIRGYLAFDYVERLSLEDQGKAVAVAIEQFPSMLLQLLDQIQPCQEHLITAIRLGADQLIEPLLQAGVSMWDDEGVGDPPMVIVVRSRGALQSKLRMLTILSRHGFSVDARSAVDSWSPLLAAVEQGCRRLVEALLALGARLSADRHLGFTPLHLACQMGHWHLLPCLVEAMQKQYQRVAAWGPSPQYISLNVADAYGRTPLDIALLRYFSSPDDRPDGKAVDVLRKFIHKSAEPGPVCGWELFQVLNFIDTIPSKKALGAQLLEYRSQNASPSASADGEKELGEEPGTEYGEVEEVLKAIRLLLQAGGQTRWLQDLLEPGSSVFKAPESTRSKFPALDAELADESSL
ncbi:unnamed protein product [Effrenium voratum]|nr:unnamed protein product [Effrenium voratum]